MKRKRPWAWRVMALFLYVVMAFMSASSYPVLAGSAETSEHRMDEVNETIKENGEELSLDSDASAENRISAEEDTTEAADVPSGTAAAEESLESPGEKAAGGLSSGHRLPLLYIRAQ